MSMNIEKKYIKSLLEEIEQKEIFKDEYKEKINSLGKKVSQLETENEMKEYELKTLKKENKRIKETVKKPVTISNPKVFDIFSEIKNGGIISFIKPTLNKRNKNYPSNPFYFEIDNKGAVFDGKLIGMWEIKGGNIYYYSCAKTATTQVCNEIMNKLFSEHDPDCQVKTLANKKPKKIKYLSAMDLLKLNPVKNIATGKFVTDGKTKWIYTHADGSKYVILADGYEEVYQ